MDSTVLLGMACELLGRVGIEVRYAHLGGAGGGLCEVRGKRIVFVDLDADVATRLGQCLLALATLPELDTLYVPPALRERIDRLGP